MSTSTTPAPSAAAPAAHAPHSDLSRIAQDLQIRKVQVEAVVHLLDEGNTVPFITRYRKERTGGLNEDVIRRIQTRVTQLRHLAERKQTILKSIEAQGKLTDALRDAIHAAETPKRLEDLYLPYKPKKRTLATEARERGLEPLALAIWNRAPEAANLNELLPTVVDPEKQLATPEDVLAGARHILAELIAETAEVRHAVRLVLWQTGKFASTKADAVQEGQGQEYRDYFQFSESVNHIPPHRILALNRGEKENVLKVKLEWEEPLVRARALEQLPQLADHPHRDLLMSVVEDALPRLILPSLEREVRRDLTELAQDHAVAIFARNLRSLLLQPPLRGKRVLAIDPGLRTGCKLAALDEHGTMIEDGVVHPHPPQKRVAEAKAKLEEMVRRHQLTVVAIGNGTACRETEKVVSELIADLEARRRGEVPPSESAPAAADQPKIPPEVPPQPDTRPESTPPDAPSEPPAQPTIPPAPPPASPEIPANPPPETPAAPPPETPSQPPPEMPPPPSTPTGPFNPSAEAETSPGSAEEAARGSAAAMPQAAESPAPPAPPPPPPIPLPEAPAELAYVIVNEAGASDYSASPVGREEFPQLDATLRGTISIGRRLQDPLSELVKIDPQHVGVGLYQHDVKAKHLKESLEGVIESCVNYVGVELNSASAPLLRHVSGLNQLVAQELINYRQQHGPFRSRSALTEVPGLGEKRYEQAAGFLKIREGDDPLDTTWVHPESYAVARQILADLGFSPEDLRDPARVAELREKLKDVNADEAAGRLNAGAPTIKDIVEALSKPGRDPREDLPPPIFRKGILKLEDLQPGMELKGTVLNVVPFGAFVDIGLKDSGLVHISQMANRYIKSPYDVVAVGDVVNVWVLSVDQDRRRASLTMIPPGTERKAPERRPPAERRPPPVAVGAGPGQGQGQGQGYGQPQRRPFQPAGQGGPGPRPGGPPPRGGRPFQGGRPQQGGPPRGGPPRGAPPAEQPPAAPPRPRTPPKPKPLPKLTQSALSGKTPLHTFGELEAFFKAKDEPPKPTESPEPAPPVAEAVEPPPPPAEPPPAPPPATDGVEATS